MNGILTFLQIIDILARWISNALRKYYIISGIIVFFDLVDYLSSPRNSSTKWWEFLAFILFFTWLYKKYYLNRKENKESSEAITNIQNTIINTGNKNRFSYKKHR